MANTSEKQARMNSLLNRKRKAETASQAAVESSSGSSSTPNEREQSPTKLTPEEEEKRKATELILREAKMAKERAERVGPQGCILATFIITLTSPFRTVKPPSVFFTTRIRLRPKSLNTNKQFLHRTLAATLPERKPKKRKSPE
ncbi:unnamed protein product [Haemonchus placei]|uniref:4F5 domain-containing protein n=1 Tax=Haemonchus placei TaxID=6290 RepID=A0A0N4WUX8_HAEPC|nr:unnamed protein product [Haemonchus placei]